MHSAILPTFVWHVATGKPTECNPQCGYTVEAYEYVISHRHATFDIIASAVL